MLLSEFNITFVSQSSIKGQALADQITERSINSIESEESAQLADEGILTKEANKEKRKLYFDEAANICRCGIKSIFISPNGNQFPTSARLAFPYTNNIVEYKACIMGLRMAIDM